jgi:PAS domain-containing protein
MTQPSVDALRSSAPDAYFVLADDDRILYVSQAFHDTRGRGVGHVFWDHLPSAREVYGPHFDEARATGRPVEALIFYAGRLKRLVVIPGGDGLAVHIENLVEVDVTSLASLLRSLEELDSALADRASEQPDRRSRASLRALP